MKNFVFINTQGGVEKVSLTDDDAMREKIGGWLEIVNPKGLIGYCLIVDEEGLLKEKECNYFGSYWYGFFEHGQPIVGDILVSKLSRNGDFVSLSEDDMNYIIGLTEKLKN